MNMIFLPWDSIGNRKPGMVHGTEWYPMKNGYGIHAKCGVSSKHIPIDGQIDFFRFCMVVGVPFGIPYMLFPTNIKLRRNRCLSTL